MMPARSTLTPIHLLAGMLIASALLVKAASSQSFNPADPNLQTDDAKNRQCQFSHNPFCNAEGDTNAEELKRQKEEYKQKIKDEKKQYERGLCYRSCDKWFGGPHTKYNAECKADCDKKAK